MQLTPPTRHFNELLLLKGKVKRKSHGVKTKIKHFVLEESDYEHPSDDSANGWFTSKVRLPHDIEYTFGPELVLKCTVEGAPQSRLHF